MQESIVPAIYDRRRLDEVLNCSDEDAFNTTRDLAIREGIFSGISSGAAVWGEIQVAKDLPRGLTVVTLLPDRGDRYLSTEVFRSICAACPPRRRRSLFFSSRQAASLLPRRFYHSREGARLFALRRYGCCIACGEE